MSHGGGRHQSYRTACVGGLSGNHVDMAKGVANGCCGECGIGSSCGIDGCGIGGVGDRHEKTWTNPVITDWRQDGCRGGTRKTKTGRMRMREGQKTGTNRIVSGGIAWTRCTSRDGWRKRDRKTRTRTEANGMAYRRRMVALDATCMRKAMLAIAGVERKVMRAITGMKHGAHHHGCNERQHHRPRPTQELRYQLETEVGS